MVHLLKKQALYNQSPLELTTFDGSNSPYHPSVVAFNTPWNGYSFWMANTPFPHKTSPYRDRYECPSIFASNDGFHWEQPNGATNPIVDLTASEIKDFDYMSDPHLFLQGETLECWYRLTKRHGLHNYSDASEHYLLRKKTTDGILWTESEVVLDITKSHGREMVSPALLYQNGYKLWIVDLKSTNKCHSINLLTSTNGHDWSEITICQLRGKKINPWHIDVQFFDGYYWLTCYEKFKDLTLWKSTDGKNFEYACKLLSPSHTTTSFYGKMLYRACLSKITDNDYRLYFSAEDSFTACIGVMQGSSPTNMQVISVDNKQHREIHNSKDLFILYLRGLKESILFKIKMKISQF